LGSYFIATWYFQHVVEVHRMGTVYSKVLYKKKFRRR